jgi:hypothetical protein
MHSTEKPNTRRELLSAYRPDKYLQVTGFWRLRHCEHFFVVVFVLGAALGLTLDEQVVEHWNWVTPFVQTVARFAPVVDSFWRVSPFPTVAGLLPAIVWLSVFLSGLLAPITVRHLRFPLMYEPLSSRRFWFYFFLAIALLAWFAVGVGDLTDETFGRRRFPWPMLNFAAQNQIAFGLLAGLTGGLAAFLWAVISLVTVRRLIQKH